MDLFGNLADKNKNLLPVDGVARYFGRVFGYEAATAHLQSLIAEVPWQQDEVVMFGKRIITKRKVAWYGGNGLAYTYSGTTRQALPWSPDLLQLKTRVEAETGESYNACLLNLYHNGEEGMSWHSDDEDTIVEGSAIASVSFGAPRRFLFKHRQSGQKVALQLEHGSLLLMQGQTQQHWLHSLPKQRRETRPRVNLTFRKMKEK